MKPIISSAKFSYKIFEKPLLKNIDNSSLNEKIKIIVLKNINNVGINDDFLKDKVNVNITESDKLFLKYQYYNFLVLKKLNFKIEGHGLQFVGSPDIEGMLDEKFSACGFVVELNPQGQTTLVNIGCSNGEDLFKMSAMLSTKGLNISNCIGYDINPIAIAQAKEAVEIFKQENYLGNFEFQIKDIVNDFPKERSSNPVDIVCAFRLITVLDFKSIKTVFSNLQNRLSKDDILLISYAVEDNAIYLKHQSYCKESFGKIEDDESSGLTYFTATPEGNLPYVLQSYFKDTKHFENFVKEYGFKIEKESTHIEETTFNQSPTKQTTVMCALKKST